jgi:hypothetical protein
VDKADFAAIPSSAVCMNCHHAILPNSEKLAPVRQSYETGQPIRWVKVHDLPDYAYFSHAPHVNAGVSCYECHGRVDKMAEEGVFQVENLSMSWCLECHREPEQAIRPRDKVYDLGWSLEDATAADRAEIEQLHRRLPPEQVLTDCSTCHR